MGITKVLLHMPTRQRHRQNGTSSSTTVTRTIKLRKYLKMCALTKKLKVVFSFISFRTNYFQLFVEIEWFPNDDLILDLITTIFALKIWELVHFYVQKLWKFCFKNLKFISFLRAKTLENFALKIWNLFHFCV